jgi:Rad3-related DNA helicase
MKNTINPKYLEKLADELSSQELFSLLLDHLGSEEDSQDKKPEFVTPAYLETLRRMSSRLLQRMAQQNAISKSKGTTTATFSEAPEDDKHKFRFPAVMIPNASEYLDELGATAQFMKATAALHTRLNSIEVHPTYMEHNGKGCKVRSRATNRLRRMNQLFQEVTSSNFYDTHTAALDPLGFSTLPIDVGKLVRPAIEDLFEHVVVTSATLAQEGTDFTYVRDQLGYNKPEDVVVEKVVGSPFNYADCARLYVPFMQTLPSNFNLSPWYDEISTEIIALAKASRGDGFVLFSSTKDMQAVQERTQYELEAAGIPVITQHEGTTAAACTAAYMGTKGAMLYGLRSFWEGVDVQGSKLRLVIIPKLPFPVPDDPILKTLTEKAGGGFNGFQKVAVPVMLETLRQGVGRLIRSKKDRGIIAILDSRFWSGTSNPEKHKTALRGVSLDPKRTPRGYGRQIFRSLGIKVIDSRDYACKLCNEIYGVMAAPKTKENRDGSSEG